MNNLDHDEQLLRDARRYISSGYEGEAIKILLTALHDFPDSPRARGELDTLLRGLFNRFPPITTSENQIIACPRSVIDNLEKKREEELRRADTAGKKEFITKANDREKAALGEIRATCFSDDGRIVVSVTPSQSGVFVSDTDSLSSRFKVLKKSNGDLYKVNEVNDNFGLTGQFDGLSGSHHLVCLHREPENTRMSTVFVWDVEEERAQKEIVIDRRLIAFHVTGNGRTIVCAGLDCVVTVDCRTWSVQTIRPFTIDNLARPSFKFTSDGKGSVYVAIAHVVDDLNYSISIIGASSQFQASRGYHGIFVDLHVTRDWPFLFVSSLCLETNATKEKIAPPRDGDKIRLDVMSHSQEDWRSWPNSMMTATLNQIVHRLYRNARSTRSLHYEFQVLMPRSSPRYFVVIDCLLHMFYFYSFQGDCVGIFCSLTRPLPMAHIIAASLAPTNDRVF
ncbi:MAG: hypothetical protein GYA24_10240, partial [Candidatus Lokiarchaeota archaeon]|nr:hypothetical protein [Candidatus Lokiarchaeota archaeon]